jgi:uncharacterized damage-inducible protein DinB
MKEQLIHTWQLHQQKNLLLLDAITDAGLQKTLSTRGGRTVYDQWVHLHTVRMQWLEICAKDIFKLYKVIDKTEKHDRKKLRKTLGDSALGIEALLSNSYDRGGILKGFKAGILPFTGYLIAHESHHRGNIMLTLKQCGEKLDDKVKWGLWEWK